MNNDDMARLSEHETEMALAAFLAPLLEGERVRWALMERGDGLAYLKRSAESVTLGLGTDGEPPSWLVRRWPATATPEDLEQLLSQRAVALLISDRSVLPALRDACAARFSDLRVLGLAALRGAGLAELGASPGGVAFDDSLAPARPPTQLVLLAADDLSELESYVVVALPSVAPEVARSAKTWADDLAVELAAAEVSRLETLLRQAARRRREAESELLRRGALLRDWALRAAESSVPTERPAGGSLREYALRAAAAEASREEARFAAAELELSLRAARAGAAGAGATEAALEGRARGLAARLAEVEEMREAAEAQLALAQEDVRDAAEAKLHLQRELAEAQEAIEFAMVREHGAPPAGESAEASTAAQLRELREQTSGLEQKLSTLEEERDHARAESLRLLALVGALEHAAEGMRRGHTRRVAELVADADDAARALAVGHAERLSELNGELAGLRARLLDREATSFDRDTASAMASTPSAASEPAPDAQAAEAARARMDELLDQADALRVEVAELRGVRHELTLRAADLDAASEMHAARAADLASSIAARDALVERLQLDLVEEEQRSRRREEARQRAEAECARLRDAVVRAAEDASRSTEQSSRIGELERAEAELERALREARHGRDSQREKAEAARVAADEAEARAAQAEGSLGAERERSAELSRKLERASARADSSRDVLEQTRGLLHRLDADGAERVVGRGSEITAVGSSAPDVDDTLMRSLTAQLEERNERIRGLEARLSVGDGASSRLALEETVAQLRADLARERAARESAAVAGGDEATRAELERLRQTLRDRYADMLRARSEVEGVEAQASALRSVVAEARGGLEGLLGDATATGDTTTADRVGALLRLLGRF